MYTACILNVPNQWRLWLAELFILCGFWWRRLEVNRVHITLGLQRRKKLSLVCRSLWVFSRQQCMELKRKKLCSHKSHRNGCVLDKVIRGSCIVDTSFPLFLPPSLLPCYLWVDLVNNEWFSSRFRHASCSTWRTRLLEEGLRSDVLEAGIRPYWGMHQHTFTSSEACINQI